MTTWNWFPWFQPKMKRVELKFIPYSEADALLAAGWRIAKEEDSNRAIGMVYLERVEREKS